MRQKLIISSAFVHRPEVIVVDEPHVGLDPKAIKILRDLFREYTRARPHHHDVARTRWRRPSRCATASASSMNGQDRARCGTMDELRAGAEYGGSGLEEIFLRLTGENAAREPDGRARRVTRPTVSAASGRHADGRTTHRAQSADACRLAAPCSDARSGSRRGRATRGGRARGAARAFGDPRPSWACCFWAFIFGVLYRAAELLQGRPGNRSAARRQAARADARQLLLDPAALQRDHGALVVSSWRRTSTCWCRRRWTGCALYGAKLLETTDHSSWMVVLMAVPMFTAYGMAYDGGWLFALFVIARVHPVPRHSVGDRERDHAAAREHLPGAAHARHPERHRGAGRRRASCVLFRARAPGEARAPRRVPVARRLRRRAARRRPRRCCRASGCRRAVMGLLGGEARLARAVPALGDRGRGRGASARCCTGRCTLAGFSKAQESAERWARAGRLSRRRDARARAARRAQARAGPEGDARSSSATPRSGRQLILLAVLVVVYVFNIKFLPLKGEGITFFLVNVVPFLNLVLAGFVLASIAARFIFPGVSLEGPHALAAAVEPDVDARPALGEVLGGHGCRCSCSPSASSASPTTCSR